ncbi:MAG TPA: tRNA pseudouridine(55) synthase TruB [Candidatus Nanopelagicaceae bacterium]|nr:tRNA pseudouridine(55) synthase TruB [Candidatus Nanopelagicaceae bacterium]
MSIGAVRSPARRQSGPPAVSGVLNLAKPEGITSFAAIRVARDALQERHVGHAGTLDPAASGVLPLCVGRATRLVEYILRQSKTYHARLRLGQMSDTGDLEGELQTVASAAHLTQADVETALLDFVGLVQQVPPMHSAVRHQGRHLYELARQGLTVERKARTAEIHSIRLTKFTPGEVAEAEVEVICGKGTYLRVLASDLGDKLGVGGVLAWLERTEYGPFKLTEAVSLEQLVAAPAPRALLLPPEVVLQAIPRIELHPAGALAVRRGQGTWIQRPLEGAPEGAAVEVRAHGPDGQLLAVGELTGLRFKPLKVLLPLGG